MKPFKIMKIMIKKIMKLINIGETININSKCKMDLNKITKRKQNKLQKILVLYKIINHMIKWISQVKL